MGEISKKVQWRRSGWYGCELRRIIIREEVGGNRSAREERKAEEEVVGRCE